jgi:hypothetical protein
MSALRITYAFMRQVSGCAIASSKGNRSYCLICKMGWPLSGTSDADEITV